MQSLHTMPEGEACVLYLKDGRALEGWMSRSMIHGKPRYSVRLPKWFDHETNAWKEAAADHMEPVWPERNGLEAIGWDKISDDRCPPHVWRYDHYRAGMMCDKCDSFVSDYL